MSAGAIIFMLLTMGGVLALNALCIVLWVRGRKPQAASSAETPPDAPPAEPPPAATTAEPPAS
jgi:flagellar basal body-associated protein FliL